MKNYYDLLEVTPKASKEIIEKAYRVLVKKYHPDLYQGEKRIYAEARVRELNEAYRILSDDFLRSQYDLELEKEMQFNNTNNNVKNNSERTEEIKNESKKEEFKPHKVGTFMSIVDLTKEIFKKRDRKEGKRKIQREDKIAAGLTLLIVVIIGIILWFIPATNGFIRSLIPF